MIAKRMSRRDVLRGSGLLMSSLVVAACQPKIVEVEKIVTKEVEKEVTREIEKTVKETVVVTEKELQVVTPTPGAKKAGEMLTIRYGTFWAMERINIMNKGIQLFQQKFEDIVIAVEMGGSQYRDKLAVQMAAGTEPDCGICDVYKLPHYASSGLNLDLFPACEAKGMDIKKNYRLQGIEIWEDKLLGMPWVTFGNGIYYNKTVFKEVGVPDPYDDLGGSWSCDQFIDICKKLKEAKTEMFPLNVDVKQLYHASAGFLYGRCARLYDWQKYQYTLNEPETVKAVDWLLTELYHTGYIIDPESTSATAMAGMLDPFSGGAVAMQHLSAGNVGITKTRIGDTFDWDIAPYPSLSGKVEDHSAFVSHDPNFVSAKTEKRDAATEFILFCAQEEMQNILSKDKLSLPSLKTAPFVEGGFLTPPPNHTSVFNDPWETGHLITAWFHNNTLEATKVMAREVEYMMVKQKTAQEACDAMQKDLTALIDYKVPYVPISQWFIDFPNSCAMCK